jgi:archaellum biogenesis ATPase FlaH
VLFSRPSADDEWPDQRCATGVGQLDAMLGGGIPLGTATLVLGASGCRKDEPRSALSVAIVR